MKKAVLFVVVSLAPTLGQARTITVDDDGPADFNNIQAAIDVASNGDTVELLPSHEKTLALPWKSRHGYLQTRVQEIRGGTGERGVLSGSEIRKRVYVETI